LWWSSWA